MKHKIALISVGVPWFDVDYAQDNLNRTRQLLEQTFTVSGPRAVLTDAQDLSDWLEKLRSESVSAAVLQIGTFPDGNTPAQVAETLQVPVVLSGFPEASLEDRVGNNSLCGLNMATYTLRELGHRHSWCFGAPGSEAHDSELTAQLLAATTLSSLRGSVIGLLGYRAPGFYPATFDELLLRRTFGIRVVHLGIQTVTDLVKDGAHRDPPMNNFPTIEGDQLTPEAISWLGRYYGALYGAVAAAGLTAVAVKDWPEMAPFDPSIPAGIWPAVSWLQDDGINTAPEGDVNGAVTMQLLNRLSGQAPFFSDISALDESESTLTLWHYGGAPSLARSRDEIRLSQDGRELEFTLKPGPAVLARLGYSGGAYRLLTIEVEVLDERLTLRRAAARVRTINTPAGDVVRELLDGGWEHHVSLVHGKHAASLRAFAKLSGLPLTNL